MFVFSANGDVIGLDENGSPMAMVENAEETEWHCVACGDAVSEEPEGYIDASGARVCAAYDPFDDPAVDDVDSAPDFGEGPHRADRVALSWCNSAGIHTDETEDSVTVTISVGDPRGALAFTVRRIPDDAPTNAGRLLLHTPYRGESRPHAALTPAAGDGAYWLD